MGCLGNLGSMGREGPAAEVDCEVRPGGMLVQKRGDGDDGEPLPRILLRVSYAAATIVVSVGSRATFGDLKKLLLLETGLQPGDQKLIYRRKERADSDYLDLCGVKHKSRVTLMEDPCSIERRYIEMKKNARIQIVQRAILDVTLEIDKLADQVTTMVESISNGHKVAEVQITTLMELLMRQAIRLDTIPVEGDTFFQKNMQAKRVQKCVETLDVLLVSNARLKSVVVTTKWESFDSPETANWEFFD